MGASFYMLLLFDDKRIKMARKPGNKPNENQLGCTGKGKRWKVNKRMVQRR